ncbi:hypothetical protein FRB93_013659 [Tulasnella sp. JGI-2019a]|nr:hypothetical protein FRB93_013659 [Tulasnella sp. JGI-2019a]
MLGLTLILLLLARPTPNHGPSSLNKDSVSSTSRSGCHFKAPTASTVTEHLGLCGETGPYSENSSVNPHLPSFYGVLDGSNRLIANYFANGASNSSTTEFLSGPIASRAQLWSESSPYMTGATFVYACHTTDVIPTYRRQGGATNRSARLRLSSVCYEWRRAWSTQTTIQIPHPIVDARLHQDHTGTDTKLPLVLAFVDTALVIDLGDVASQRPYVQLPLHDLMGNYTLLSIVLLLSIAITITAGPTRMLATLQWINHHCNVTVSLQITITRQETETRDLKAQLRVGKAEITDLRNTCTVLALTIQSGSISAQAQLQDRELDTDKERRQRVSTEEDATQLRGDAVTAAGIVRVLQRELTMARDGQTQAEHKATTLDAAKALLNKQLTAEREEMRQLRESVEPGPQSHAEEKRDLTRQLIAAQLGQERAEAEAALVTTPHDVLFSAVGKLYRRLADTELELEAAKFLAGSQKSQLQIQSQLLQSRDATIDQLKSNPTRLNEHITTTSSATPAVVRERHAPKVREQIIFQSAIRGIVRNAPTQRRIF